MPDDGQVEFPGVPAALTQTYSSALSGGASIGSYRLLERIGEGGMGEVRLAEQQRPVRRHVALKIIKAGLDTAQVVARFEAERQALALMDHSAIARVFDAGSTDLGRPYFVMEYVRGESITSYCDRQRLTIRERLDLFVHVCEGVQHAHQKGIWIGSRYGPWRRTASGAMQRSPNLPQTYDATLPMNRGSQALRALPTG
jgi:hypothetical protein